MSRSRRPSDLDRAFARLAQRRPPGWHRVLAEESGLRRSFAANRACYLADKRRMRRHLRRPSKDLRAHHGASHVAGHRLDVDGLYVRLVQLAARWDRTGQADRPGPAEAPKLWPFTRPA